MAVRRLFHRLHVEYCVFRLPGQNGDVPAVQDASKTEKRSSLTVKKVIVYLIQVGIVRGPFSRAEVLQALV